MVPEGDGERAQGGGIAPMFPIVQRRYRPEPRRFAFVAAVICLHSSNPEEGPTVCLRGLSSWNSLVSRGECR